jgi:Lrp/AsnC family transcriptional regulator for asnA, asnC and gidA
MTEARHSGTILPLPPASWVPHNTETFTKEFFVTLRDELDATDRQILMALQHDVKTPYQDIAERLSISTGTVHNRIKRLTQLGVLGDARAEIHIDKLGYSLFAFIGISLKEASKMEAVQKRLAAIPEVLESYFTTGEFSLIVKLVVRQTSELYHILTEKIQRIPDIQSTYTYVVLETLMRRDLNLTRVDKT